MSVAERLASLAPEQRALLEKLREKQRKAAPPPPIQPPPIPRRSGATGAGDWPLSLDQERFWFMEQLYPGGAGLNITAATRMRGPLAVPAMAAALDEIVSRHAAWRTTFPLVDGRPVQRVAASRHQPLGLIDLTSLPGDRREPEALRLVGEATAAPFDLENGPLVRSGLVRIGAEDHVCLLTVHHLVTDFLSFQIAFSELAELLAGGAALWLPEPPVQYSDFAVWQREWLQGDVLDSLVSWWRERLEGFPLALELPTDRPRPPVARMRGGRRTIAAPRALSNGLRDLARREGVTLFMTVLAASAALLHRSGAPEKLILGANNANRNRPEIEPVLGCFLTQVPFAIDLTGDPTFRELLARVWQSALGSFAHQDLPFGQLVEALQPQRDTSRQPVIQTLVQVLDASPKASLGGVSFEAVDAWDGVARYDLMLTLFDDPGGLMGSLEYDADLFDATTAERLVELLLLQAEAAAADPGMRLSELPVLTAAARHQIRVEWNEAALDGGFPASVLPFLEARIAERPEAVALSGAGEIVTYGELGRRSDRLAQRLRGLGLGPEDRIGLLLERSPAVAVAILGVWKAGAACVPLDPGLPEERLAWMAADAGLAALVDLEGVRRRGLPPPDLTPDPSPIAPPPTGRGAPPPSSFSSFFSKLPPLPVEGGAMGEGGRGGEVGRGLAYLIYTSGTTGRPKAVMVEHASLAQTLLGCLRRFGSGLDDRGPRMPHLAPFSFDISLFELLVPLLAGGQVEVLTRAEILDLDRLAASLRGATWLHGVPSLLRKLADHLRETGEEPDLRTVFAGGERVPPDLLRDLQTAFPSATVAVLYGPTEAAVLCAAWVAGEAGERSLLGRPLPGVELLLLDRWLSPVPLGVPGELHVGGSGVARGYLGRPDLTADRFVPDRLGARFYRTGDLARLLPDGVLEFLGRTDHQVKLRGFRIEPGEIETALTEHPAVREAAVVARGEGDGMQLVAYVAPAGLDPSSLREHLAARLPAYMVPATFVVLPELPLTANAKVDRARLPTPERTPDAAEEAPRTPAEEVVAGIWSEVLGVPRVTRTDNFFDLGGHSLLATQVMSRLRAATGAELAVRELFQAPTVAALAAALEASLSAGASAAAAPPIRPVSRDRALPLSFAQERLWFLDHLAPGISAYHIPLAVALRGALAPEALERALEGVTVRHESLRTRFGERDRRAVQIVDPPRAWDLPRVDLSSLPAAWRAAEAHRLASDEAGRPFDLAHGPVLRSLLLRLGPAEHVLLLCVHHIAADGWSLGVMIQEISALYRAAVEGGAAGLPELPVQYADFAVWQRAWLQGEVLERQLAYWRERLAGAAGLDLPTDRPRPARQSFRGATRMHAVAPEATRALATLARRHDATFYMVLLSALQTLLGRYAGQEDVVVGSPIANRTRAEVEPLIGFFVNSLALRGDLAGDPPFSELIARSRRSALEAYSHQDLPFERLVEELNPERNLALNPVFQVMFAVQNAPLRPIELPGLTLAPVELDFPVTRFDLEVFFTELDGGLATQLTWSTDLFDAASIQRFAGHLDALLAAVLDDPGQRLSEIPLLAPPERHQLLAEWNDTAAGLPQEDVASLFAGQARRRPSAVAISSEGGDLTYADLDRRSARLARRLAAQGVGPEVPVALLARRSPALIVGLLGILKAGGAYVPLDPSYPAERLAWMLADCGARILLGQPELLEGVTAPSIVELSADPEEIEGPDPVGSFPDGLAYLMYTSGSTGRPKGVGVTHRNIVRLVRESGFADLGPEQVFLQLAPVSFDASTLEIWAPLANGGRLALFPPRPPSLEELGEAIARQGVTSLWLTAGLFHQMVDDRLEALRPLRQLLAGGDVLSPPHVRRALEALPDVTLINGYGPTEGTTFTTCHPMTAPEQVGPTVSLGRPIGNTQVYVLGPDLRPVPAGIWGELCAGGGGVSRGYLGRPDLTAERFVPDPFGEPGARMYRTGDIARFRPDGRLEFRGRRDGQVKLRGFRVELGEIESALARCPGVRAAAVAVRGDAEHRRLVAWVVPDSAEPELVPELRRRLEAELPDHMVPSAFVLLEALPLTLNGKVDRAALPASERIGEAAGTWVEPATPLERTLARVTAEVLGLGRVGMRDNFFELGGHSLLATQLVSRLRQDHGLPVSLQMVFDAATLADLAGQIGEREGEEGSAAPAARIPRRPPGLFPVPTSFAQERLWFLDRLAPGGTAYNIPLALRIQGDVSPAFLEAILGEIVRRHETLRTTFAEHEGQPIQLISPPGSWTLPVVDLSALPAAVRDPESLLLARDAAGRPFDLERGPLLYAVLLRLADAEHALLLGMHHIVADGWSMGVLVREITAFYGGSPLPELPVQYADFAVWQRAWLEGGELERQLAYWREQLAGAPALELPADRPRPAVPSHHGAVELRALPPERVAGLARLARRHDASPFMIFLAGFQALLARHTGQDDIVVGSPIANRNRAEIEPLIGFFVNSLVLRGDLAGDPAFSALIDGARRTALEAYAHQDLPFERLVEEMRPERRLSSNPLFQVVLAVQNAPLGRMELPGLALTPLELDVPATRFDLEVTVWEVDAGLTLQLIYDIELFDRATIERLAGRFDRLLAAIVEEPEEPGLRLSALPLLSATERRELLHLGSGVAWEPGPDLLDRIAAQAARAPQSLAVSSAAGRLTYGELAAGASRLAGALQDLGVGPDVPVGLHVERSPELVLGALAVLLAGGAYVPLDPSHPEERLAFMVRESGMPVLLSALLDPGEPPAWAGEARVVGIETGEAAGSPRPPVRCAPENLAYVIYTSGSTGRPKGVQVPRRGLLGLVDWHLRAYGVTGRDRATLLASPSFDASVWEVWPYLAAGASLYVPDEETRLEPGRLLAWMAAEGITLAFLPTPLAELFVERAEEGLPEGFALRALLAGGDRLQRAPRRLLPFALVNHYGPTESSVVATWAPVPAAGRRPPAIGRPIDGTRVSILDHGELALAGVPGELAIGGAGLARGYLGRPDLTAERFVPDPWAGLPGERIYRTGDRVRWRPEGGLDFLGRIDRQVKLRGFRIEPGEIESALQRHPRVREAVVTARDDGAQGRHLVAYVVPRAAEAAAPEEEAVLHLSHWQELYDETYGRGPDSGGAEDPSFNIQGWNSSYTGEPIPAEEMREWQEGTVDRLLALPHRRVIEVGCGTGLLLFRIAPHAERYRGTDFSAVALGQVRAALSRRGLPQVELAQGLADDWIGVSPGDFELVVLNSVVQYFPSVDYLVRVLEGAVAAVAPGGAVFVGDVRSRPLLEAFYTSVELFQAPPGREVADLRRRVRRRVADEEELVLDPAFFHLLAQRLPAITGVDLLLKRGRHHNELTRFRYDVVLHVGPHVPVESPDPLLLSGLPNARLTAEAAALELLAGAGQELETVEELRQAIVERTAPAIDPEDLQAQGERLGYEVELTVDPTSPFRFGAVLRGGAAAFPPLPGGRECGWERGPGGEGPFANDPLRGRLVPELRRLLQAELPDYMVPAAFVLLDRLPLTVHGKVDRAALPEPDPVRPSTASAPPRTPLEISLAAIWREVLGMEEVGLDDDFFELGGHSLLATQVTSRIRETLGVDLPLRALFEAPSLAGLAGRIENLQRSDSTDGLPPLLPVPRGRNLPLSFAQERLWFLAQLAPGSPAYNMPFAARLTGRLDRAALAAALSEIVRRHETLRTTFRMGSAGRPAQVIYRSSQIPLPLLDLSSLPEAARGAEARRLAAETALAPFDLARGPLVRSLLIRLAAAEHAVLWVTHHIAADGWSIGAVFLPELSALYAAFAQGRPSPLPDLPVQYADFAVWQRGWLQGERLEEQIGYWRRQLAGAATLELPTDHPRRPVPSARGASRRWTLSAERTERLRDLAREQGATLFMALHAGFAALLQRTTGMDDVVVGMPVASRTRTEIEGLIGFFVNTLVLRTDLAGDPDYPAVLTRSREAALGAFAHQDLPFEKLVDELGLPRDPYRPPLLRVLLQLQNAPGGDLELPGLTLAPFATGAETARFELVVNLFEGPDGLSATLTYDTDLFEDATIARLGAHCEALLGGWMETPDRPLSELSFLSTAERHQLLVEWNGESFDCAVTCLHHRFEEQVDRVPDAPALSAAGERLTYRELDERANRFAHHLLAAGTLPGDRVALCLERSAGMVATILAVLKAGAAYVPLDPAWPAERLAHALEDSGALLLITEGDLVPPGVGPRRVHLDADREAIERRSAGRPAVGADPALPAYVIYTSGSTGKPKGVVVTHANVDRLLTATAPWFGFGPADVWTLFHSYAFDFSVWELWGSLRHGGRLVVVPYWESRSPEDFYRLLKDERVTVLNQTPSAFRQLLWAEDPHPLAPSPTRTHAHPGEGESPLALRWVIFGGEALELSSLAPWFERHGDRQPRLVNMYGITETTVHVTFRLLEAEDLGRGSVVGRPIPDLSVHVLDPALRPQPIGVPGEIHVGGAGLALGYLGRPDLTAERFVPDPFSGEPGARLYRSGDLARRLPDGDLESLGRIDRQIKIRGFRIELGEIEAALSAHPAVRDSAVLAREGAGSSERRLVAYVVPPSSPEPLRAFLADRLPDYMVPSAFVFLDALPLTPNGKVDRRALPAPEEAGTEPQREHVPPRSDLERFLAGLLQDVLGLPAEREIGVHDDFFTLGGNSILGAILIHRLQETLREIVHVVAIFDHPTVASLATYIKEQHPAAARRIWGEGEAGEEAAPAALVGPAEVAEMRRLIVASRPAPVPEPEEPRNPPALFVLSAPRSGSTLLRVMLGAHPELFAPPELELLTFRTLEERHIAFQGRDRFWLEGLVRAVMEARGVSAADAERIIEDGERQGWTTRRFYRELQEWLGGRMLVDKTPSYALDPEVLRRAEAGFAGARYLHLIRHPQAALRSFEEARLDQIFFRQPHPFTRRQLAELVWTESNRNILGFLEDVPAGRWTTVRFEELVREPERVLREACEFLGLDFHPQMAEPYREGTARMVDGPHAVSRMLGDVKFLTHGRVDPAAAERWREAGEAPLGGPARELAEELGYPQKVLERGVLVPLQQGTPDRRPLFCVHPVGGEVVAYRELARRLPGQTVYGLQSPEKPLDDLREVAALYLDAVQQVQPQGPYRLAGWSMGGVVAFEMARQLNERGEQVELLALIDTVSPVLWAQEPEPDDTGLVAAFALDLARLSGATVPDVDLTGLDKEGALALVLKLGREAGVLAPGVELADLRRLFDRFRANRRALSTYEPHLYEGEAVLFRAHERPAGREEDPALGWTGLVANLTVREVPGDHYTILREDVEALAGHMRLL